MTWSGYVWPFDSPQMSIIAAASPLWSPSWPEPMSVNDYSFCLSRWLRARISFRFLRDNTTMINSGEWIIYDSLLPVGHVAPIFSFYFCQFYSGWWRMFLDFSEFDILFQFLHSISAMATFEKLSSIFSTLRGHLCPRATEHRIRLPCIPKEDNLFEEIVIIDSIRFVK